MQTYIFTVAVNGDDVQNVAEDVRSQVISLCRAESSAERCDIHVTPSVRVTH